MLPSTKITIFASGFTSTLFPHDRGTRESAIDPEIPAREAGRLSFSRRQGHHHLRGQGQKVKTTRILLLQQGARLRQSPPARHQNPRHTDYRGGHRVGSPPAGKQHDQAIQTALQHHAER